MTVLLFRGGRIATPFPSSATALVVRDATIAWLGPDDAPEADGHAVAEVIELDGALLTPAFVDTHVHATSTGLALCSLDLSGCRTLADALSAVDDFAFRNPGRTVIGQGWDDTRWPERRPPTAAELDRAGAGADVYLSRVDVHSAVCSSALLDAVPDAAAKHGYHADGHLTLDAHHEVRRAVYAGIGVAQRADAQRAALAEAARLGIGCIHENAGPGVSSEDDLAALLAIARDEDLPQVVGYWGELASDKTIALAGRHGLAGLAGDLFADGSLGSHTACLSDPYLDEPEAARGHAYLGEDDIERHVIACSRLGLQAGFHAIGDGAIDIVLAGFRTAAGKLGRDAIRAGRHRLEHLQLVTPAQLATMAELDILASVQPLSDALWGGQDGMYASRIGAGGAERTNPYRAMADAGVRIAFSSDAPVMPLGGWAAIRAAANHHTARQRLDRRSGLVAQTVAGHLAAGTNDPAEGRLVPGAPATFAVWDHGGALDRTGLPLLAPGTPDPDCLRTVVSGRTLWKSE